MNSHESLNISFYKIVWSDHKYSLIDFVHQFYPLPQMVQVFRLQIFNYVNHLAVQELHYIPVLYRDVNCLFREL